MAIEKTKYENSPPDVPLLMDALDVHRIRYVVTGSVGAGLYGVEVQPGDFDITPALDLENLDRLGQMLLEIEASLPATDQVGQWEVQSDGERRWVSRAATPGDIVKRAAWAPDPADVSTFDHSFRTRYGNFDVVPDLSGGYDALIVRAKKLDAYGRAVWVAHVDELLAALTVPRRKKDIVRVRQLREIQRLQNE
jgi:hypothetical protein